MPPQYSKGYPSVFFLWPNLIWTWSTCTLQKGRPDIRWPFVLEQVQGRLEWIPSHKSMVDFCQPRHNLHWSRSTLEHVYHLITDKRNGQIGRVIVQIWAYSHRVSSWGHQFNLKPPFEPQRSAKARPIIGWYWDDEYFRLRRLTHAKPIMTNSFNISHSIIYFQL